MRVVIQRVAAASVTIEGVTRSEIVSSLLVYVGIDRIQTPITRMIFPGLAVKLYTSGSLMMREV